MSCYLDVWMRGHASGERDVTDADVSKWVLNLEMPRNVVRTLSDGRGATLAVDSL